MICERLHSSVCTCVVALLSSVGISGWTRVWGTHKLAAPLLSPCFGIRLITTPKASVDDSQSLVLGVSRKKDTSLNCSWNGVDENCHVIFSSTRKTWVAGFASSEQHGMVAIERQSRPYISSRILSTKFDPSTGTDPGSSFIDPTGGAEGVTIGFHCDFVANTLRFYINDEIVRVTDQQYGMQSANAADAGIKPGQPFVWHIKDLGECFVYLCAFHTQLRAWFVPWQPPPLPLPLPPLPLAVAS